MNYVCFVKAIIYNRVVKIRRRFWKRDFETQYLET